jgi:hypothetical protein
VKSSGRISLLSRSCRSLSTWSRAAFARLQISKIFMLFKADTDCSFRWIDWVMLDLKDWLSFVISDLQFTVYPSLLKLSIPAYWVIEVSLNFNRRLVVEIVDPLSTVIAAAS